MSETRRYRKFTAQQKLELVMASLRGERSIAELERALGKKTYELEILGNGFRAWE